MQSILLVLVRGHRARCRSGRGTDRAVRMLLSNRVVSLGGGVSGGGYEVVMRGRVIASRGRGGRGTCCVGGRYQGQ